MPKPSQGSAPADHSNAIAVAVGIAVVALIVAALAVAVAMADDKQYNRAPNVAAPSAQTVAPVVPQATASQAPAREDDRPVTAGVSPDWVQATASASGISPVAVAAYGAATLRLATEQPTCKVGWTTLAGIGAIESGHGTNGGSTLKADGTTTKDIIGPALNGQSGFAAIASTPDSVKWHGDKQWDRAVGPMQFIPSTWAKWQSDGDQDGVKDPHNLFDAAYAAARYLCASGGDLTTGEAWSRAVFSYNHSDQYVRDVLARANAYAGAQ
jgi:membrane-bound lytic murein transglycosylase B